MGIRKNKKGDASNYITFVIIVFFLAVSLLITAFMNDQIYEAINTTELNDTSVSPNVLTQLDLMTTSTIQNGFVAIFAFLIIGMMVSSFMVRIHPIWLFIYIIFLAITLFTAMPLANAYQLLMNNEALSSVADQQNMINWIMENLVMITLGAGALSLIVTFAKLSGGEQYSSDL